MRLTEKERSAFALAILHLMNRDLVARGPEAKKRDKCVGIRVKYRSDVAKGLGRPFSPHAHLREESITAVLSKMSELTDAAHNLAILVDLSVAEPWYEAKVRVSPEAKRIVTSEIATAMGGVDADAAAGIALSIADAARGGRFSSNRVLWIAGIGTLGAVFTGGLLAAPIAAAVGSAGTGLAGAAAITHGLAVLGGGSVAAGGLGMAGGTALLSGVGGLAGAGAGVAGTRQGRKALLKMEPDQAAIEVIKAYALILALRANPATQREARDAFDAFRAQCAELMHAVVDEEAKGEKRDRKLVKELSALRDTMIRLRDKLEKST